MLRTEASIRIEREWAMPSAWTFTIPPIAGLIAQEMGVKPGIWVDPFAGMTSPAGMTNDLNPDMPTKCHEDGLAFLKTLGRQSVDGVLFDPPYSISQAAEMYREFGKDKLDVSVANMGYWAAVKDEMARITRTGGKVICCGWSSNGLGEGRGFRMTRLLLVPHGGSKNDTIVTVEVKQQGLLL